MFHRIIQFKSFVPKGQFKSSLKKHTITNHLESVSNLLCFKDTVHCESTLWQLPQCTRAPRRHTPACWWEGARSGKDGSPLQPPPHCCAGWHGNACSSGQAGCHGARSSRLRSRWPQPSSHESYSSTVQHETRKRNKGKEEEEEEEEQSSDFYSWQQAWKWQTCATITENQPMISYDKSLKIRHISRPQSN